MWRFSIVPHQVISQRALVSERRVTDGAGEWFFVAVNQLMVIKTLFTGKLSLAQVTLKQSLVGMGSQMIF